MSDLVPYSPRPGGLSVTAGVSGALERREDRAMARKLSRLERAKSLNLAHVQTKAEVQAARAHAVAYVGESAMQAVATRSCSVVLVKALRVGRCRPCGDGDGHRDRCDDADGKADDERLHHA